MDLKRILKELQIIPTELLVLHENSDPNRVERINQNLQHAGTLKHPIIVTKIPHQERYMVIDGANRATSFKVNEVPHIIAQVVDYHEENVEVLTWNHVISGMTLDTLSMGMNAIEHIHHFDVSHDEEQSIQRHDAILRIISEDKTKYVQHKTGIEKNTFLVLDAIVNIYRQRCDILRSSSQDWALQKRTRPDMSALIIFEKIEPSNILSNVANGIMMPEGVTRHIIQNRCLNINFPMSILNSSQTIWEKREYLEKWIYEIYATGKVRYYSESTIQFND